MIENISSWTAGAATVVLGTCLLAPLLRVAARRMRRQGIAFAAIACGFLVAMATKPVVVTAPDVEHATLAVSTNGAPLSVWKTVEVSVGETNYYYKVASNATVAVAYTISDAGYRFPEGASFTTNFTASLPTNAVELTDEQLPSKMLPGAGTAADPYRIYDYGDLVIFKGWVEGGTNTSGKVFKQMKDIDMSATATDGWVGIGTLEDRTGTDPTFKGFYDGNDKKITNLTFSDDDYNGLFASASGAAMVDLSIDVLGAKGGGAAAFVGCAENCAFTNLLATGKIGVWDETEQKFTVCSHSCAGIAVRMEQNSEAYACTNRCEIWNKKDKLGGIVALGQTVGTVRFTLCSNEGKLHSQCTAFSNSDGGVGGIIGWIGHDNGKYVTGNFTDCRSVADIEAVGLTNGYWNYVGSFYGTHSDGGVNFYGENITLAGMRVGGSHGDFSYGEEVEPGLVKLLEDGTAFALNTTNHTLLASRTPAFQFSDSGTISFNTNLYAATAFNVTVDDANDLALGETSQVGGVVTYTATNVPYSATFTKGTGVDKLYWAISATDPTAETVWTEFTDKVENLRYNSKLWVKADPSEADFLKYYSATNSYTITDNATAATINLELAYFPQKDLDPQYAGRDGTTAEKAWVLRSEADFVTLKNFVAADKTTSNVFFEVVSDNIQLSSWEGIGSKSNPFRGTLDGKGRTVKVQFQHVKTIGLFNGISDGEIRNLTVEVTGFAGAASGSWCVAAFAGEAADTIFTNCVAKGDITNVTHNVGAFVIRDDEISGTKGTGNVFVDCVNRANVSGNYTKVGGFMGYQTKAATFRRCVNEGTITHLYNCTSDDGGCGGFVGLRQNQLYIESCTNKGAVVSHRILYWQGVMPAGKYQYGQLMGAAATSGGSGNLTLTGTNVVRDDTLLFFHSSSGVNIGGAYTFATVKDGMATLVAPATTVEGAVEYKAMDSDAKNTAFTLASADASLTVLTNLCVISQTADADGNLQPVTTNNIAFSGTVSVGSSLTAGYQMKTVSNETSVVFSLEPRIFSLTYELDGGAVATANPATYTVESEDITLVNPTKRGYAFAGWTGTGLSGATVTVTIPKGSTGDRSYTATWKDKSFPGAGTAAEPFQLGTDEDMLVLQNWVAHGTNTTDKFFALTGNITLGTAEAPWTGIGWHGWGGGTALSFSGTFLGNGNKITVYMGGGRYHGVFNYLKGATAKDVVIDVKSWENTDVADDGGALVGIAEQSTIVNVTSMSDVEISTDGNMGGIAGLSRGATFESCTNKADLATLFWHIGGICSYSESGDEAYGTTVFTSCVNEGDLRGTRTTNYDSTSSMGGIVGWNNGSSTLTSCVNKGTITPSATFGKSASKNKYGTIVGTWDKSTPTFSGTFVAVDGMVGSQEYSDAFNWALPNTPASGLVTFTTPAASVTEAKTYKAMAPGLATAFALDAADASLTIVTNFMAYTGTVGVDASLAAGYDLKTVSNETSVVFSLEPKTFSLAYELDGGAVETANPTTYTVETEAFTLVNPTKRCYAFAGWTGTDLSGATVTVTIPKGSTGNRSYTATWTDKTLPGAGTADNPFVLEADESFTILQNWLAHGTNTADLCFKLTNDVTLTDWTGIGTSANQFKGTFDGAGHTITLGLGSALPLALFNYTHNATIQDLIVDIDFNWTGSAQWNSWVAAVVSRTEGGTFNRVKVTGTITTDGDAGGLVAMANTADGAGDLVFNDCTNAANITVGYVKVGGILMQRASDNATQTIRFNNCVNLGTLVNNTATATDHCAGGIMGWGAHMSATTVINGCSGIGTITCPNNPYGMLAGANYDTRPTFTGTNVGLDNAPAYGDGANDAINFAVVDTPAAGQVTYTNPVSSVTGTVSYKVIHANGKAFTLAAADASLTIVTNFAVYTGTVTAASPTEYAVSETADANGVTYALVPYVAMLDTDPVTRYATVAAAIAAADDGRKITVIADCTETTALTIAKNIVFDIDGHEVTLAGVTVDAAASLMNSKCRQSVSVAGTGWLKLLGKATVNAGKSLDMSCMPMGEYWNGIHSESIAHGGFDIAANGKVTFIADCGAYVYGEQTFRSPNFMVANLPGTFGATFPVKDAQVAFTDGRTWTSDGASFVLPSAEAKIDLKDVATVGGYEGQPATCSFTESYATLTNALAALKGGETINLTKDVTVAGPAGLTLDKDCTIDLNGHLLTLGDFAMTLNCNLTFKNSDPTKGGLLNKAQITIAGGKMLDCTEFTWSEGGLRPDPADPTTARFIIAEDGVLALGSDAVAPGEYPSGFLTADAGGQYWARGVRYFYDGSVWAEGGMAKAKIGSKGYASLAEAVTNAVANDTIVLIQNVDADGIRMATDDVTLELNGKTLSIATAFTNAANVKVVNGKATGGLANAGTVTVATGTLDMSALTWGAGGFIPGGDGALAISNGAVVAMGTTDGKTPNWMAANNPAFLALCETGAVLSIGDAAYTKDADGLWVVAGAVAKAEVTGTGSYDPPAKLDFTDTYAALQGAFGAVTNGGTVTLVADCGAATVDKALTLAEGGFAATNVSLAATARLTLAGVSGSANAFRAQRPKFFATLADGARVVTDGEYVYRAALDVFVRDGAEYEALATTVVAPGVSCLEPYATFAEAFAAVVTNGTVRLCQDVSADGFTIKYGMTLDLGGKTLTLAKATASTRGILVSASASGVTIRAGTVAAGCTAIRTLVDTLAADLTLDGVLLDGATVADTTKAVYALNVEEGRVAVTNGTVITMPKTDKSNAYAFGASCPNTSSGAGTDVSFADTVSVTGQICIVQACAENAVKVAFGGAAFAEGYKVSVGNAKAGFYETTVFTSATTNTLVLANGTKYSWKESGDLFRIVQGEVYVDGKPVKSLQEAVDTVLATGKPLTLAANVTLEEPLVVTNTAAAGVSIDLAGCTLTGDIAVTNATLTVCGDQKRSKVIGDLIVTNGTLTLAGGEYQGRLAATEGKVTVSNATIVSTEPDVAAIEARATAFDIRSSRVTGASAVALTDGSLTVSNAHLKATGNTNTVEVVGASTVKFLGGNTQVRCPNNSIGETIGLRAAGDSATIQKQGDVDLLAPLGWAWVGSKTSGLMTLLRDGARIENIGEADLVVSKNTAAGDKCAWTKAEASGEITLAVADTEPAAGVSLILLDATVFVNFVSEPNRTYVLRTTADLDAPMRTAGKLTATATSTTFTTTKTGDGAAFYTVLRVK